MEIKKINIIGFGNVGQNIFNHLDYRVEIVTVYNRSNTQYIKSVLGKRLVNSLNELSTDVDLNIVSSTDSSIISIIESLPKKVAIVHTSGSISKDVLNEFDSFGVFYPLQTFTKGREIQMSEVPFLLEANSSVFLNEITEFTQDNFTNNIHYFNSQQRSSIHIAAVFINNFTTLMVREAESILKINKINLSILEPLLKETVAKIIETNPKSSQTGPAHRNDMNVIYGHINEIGDKSRKEIYKLLTYRIIDLNSNS